MRKWNDLYLILVLILLFVQFLNLHFSLCTSSSLLKKKKKKEDLPPVCKPLANIFILIIYVIYIVCFVKFIVQLHD